MFSKALKRSMFCNYIQHVIAYIINCDLLGSSDMGNNVHMIYITQGIEMVIKRHSRLLTLFGGEKGGGWKTCLYKALLDLSLS